MNGWRAYKSFIKLASLLCALPLIAWFLGLRGTVASWQEYREKLGVLEKLRMESDGSSLPRVKEVFSSQAVLQDGQWLKKLSPMLTEGETVVSKYTPYLLRTEGSVRIDIGELTLSGDFISLVKLLDFIERDKSLGKVVSVAFGTTVDRVKKKKQLKMTLWIQQLSVHHRE